MQAIRLNSLLHRPTPGVKPQHLAAAFPMGRSDSVTFSGTAQPKRTIDSAIHPSCNESLRSSARRVLGNLTDSVREDLLRHETFNITPQSDPQAFRAIFQRLAQGELPARLREYHQKHLQDIHQRKQSLVNASREVQERTVAAIYKEFRLAVPSFPKEASPLDLLAENVFLPTFYQQTSTLSDLDIELRESPFQSRFKILTNEIVIPQQQFRYLSAAEMDCHVNHETYHAIDALVGFERHGKLFSACATFQSLYRQEIEQAQKNKKLGPPKHLNSEFDDIAESFAYNFPINPHFTREWVEPWAEIGATLSGEGSWDKALILKLFPQTREWLRQQLAAAPTLEIAKAAATA